MKPPKVYIDTTVLRFSATQLPRLRLRRQTINWSGQAHELTVHDLVHINPNDSIDNPELKAEVELLPALAQAGKKGQVKYVIHPETLFESWGIPKMDSQTGKFYAAPLEAVDAPVEYSRVLIGMGVDARQMQYEFLSRLKDRRFLDLQKMTGAFQGEGKLNRNQLLDAFHLWCAEHNKCDYFLTLDFSLIRVLRNNKRSQPLVHVIRPSELLERTNGSI
jgi:hypothetical protein